jgi:hypothetical protein
MLGFVLGALFFWALPKPKPPEVPTAVVTTPEKAPPRVVAPPRVTAIEAIFAEWGRFAVWENDVTEVALWNPDVNRYADRFEVLRMNGNYYFRTISRFTRPLLTHGVPNESPLQFTETEEHRQRFLKDVSDENRRSFSDAVRETFVGKRPEAKEPPAPTVEPRPSPTSQP